MFQRAASRQFADAVHDDAQSPRSAARSGSRLWRHEQGGAEGGGTLFRFDTEALTALSQAKLWVGLKNSDAVGLNVDLLVEVLAGTAKIGEGQLDNVSTGSSAFNNARLEAIPLSLTDPGPVSLDAGLSITSSVRRTCADDGHLTGVVRLWYNGKLLDDGAARDAGSRIGVTIGEHSTSYFLRAGQALSETAGTSRKSVDVVVDSKEPCPTRTFKPFGTWTIAP